MTDEGDPVSELEELIGLIGRDRVNDMFEASRVAMLDVRPEIWSDGIDVAAWEMRVHKALVRARLDRANARAADEPNAEVSAKLEVIGDALALDAMELHDVLLTFTDDEARTYLRRKVDAGEMEPWIARYFGLFADGEEL